MRGELEALEGSRVHYGKYHTEVFSGPIPLARQIGGIKTISVILPVFNALPYLQLAIRDVLKQEVGGGLELIISDDCSSDGSFEWICELCKEMKGRGLEVEAVDVEDRGVGGGSNPSKAMGKREGADMEVDGGDDEGGDGEGMSAAEVASCVAVGVRLVHVRQKVRTNRGQGETQSRCLRFAKGKYVGFMEADDERDDDNFSEMVTRLELKEGRLDAVCCSSRTIGWKREGMERYIEWQNTLVSGDDMKAARFIEIPSLMQAMVIRREALLDCLVKVDTEGGAEGGAEGGMEGGTEGGDVVFMDSKMWSIDYHFWLTFFEMGKRVEKLEGVRVEDELAKTKGWSRFRWRQHPGQQTRNHGRLSIENLRKCKCQVIARMAQNFVVYR